MADTARQPVRQPRRDETAIPNIRAVGRPWQPTKDIYHFLLRRSWTVFFLVVASGFLCANALIALLFVAQPGGIQNARPGSFEDAVFFSVQTLATIGYGGMAPVTPFVF